MRAFFGREARPHVAGAWIDTGKRDPKDGRVGLIGCEIIFNRHLYRYTPQQPLGEVDVDIRAIEGDIVRRRGDGRAACPLTRSVGTWR